jgi:hypothetical protein
MPLFANSLAQLELIPGPPPTISATSPLEGRLAGTVMRRAPIVKSEGLPLPCFYGLQMPAVLVG